MEKPADRLRRLFHTDPRVAGSLAGRNRPSRCDFNLETVATASASVPSAFSGLATVNKDKAVRFLCVFAIAAPVATNDSEPGRTKNRRVELVKALEF